MCNTERDFLKMKSTFDTSPRKTSEIGFVPSRNTDFKNLWEPEHAQNRERIAF